MVLDYKDVAFSFQQKKIRRRRQRLKVLLLALAFLAAFAGYRFMRVRSAIGSTQDLLLAGRLEEGEKRIAALSGSIFSRADLRELRALSDLLHDRLPQARAQLDRLKSEGAATSLRSGLFQKYFLDRGEYLKLKMYTDYRLAQGGDESIWFHALVQAALLEGNESEKAAARLSPAFQKSHAKALALLAKVNRDLRLGRCDYVFDRHGTPVAVLDVRRRRTRSGLPGLDLAAFDRQAKNGLSYYHLTLDARMQNAAHRLFSGYHGTLLLLKLPENAIIAAYSKPRGSPDANSVFFARYEPGSTVKIISLLAYLRQNDHSVFPFDCPGRITLTARSFYDSPGHGRVQDYTQALDISCNIGFARMGLIAGFRPLAGLLELFHFNAPPWRDEFLEFRAGTYSKEPPDDFRLANLAVGLNEISLTTVHAALLAAVLSQDGTLHPPYLIEDAKSILDLGYHAHRPRPLRLLNDDLNFRRIKKAIRQTLALDSSTKNPSRRGAAELAVKTGIGGDPRLGLDAMAIGFFPFDQPRYAFAFRLEGAGKTELKHAGFLSGLISLLLEE
jgi:hypothetical protein